VTWPPAAQNALATSLEEFERLGLVRPASVLVTEYLGALTAEHVIDAETACRTLAAYHRERYGDLHRNESEEAAAIENLRAAAAAFGSLPLAERQSLARQIASRLQPQPVAGAALHVPGPAIDPESLRGTGPLGLSNAAIGTITHEPTDPSNADSSHEPGLAPESEERGGRRILRIRSVPLETAILVGLGLIVFGYVFRNGIDRTIGPNRAETPANGRPRTVPRDVWNQEDYWAHNLRRRAEHLAALRQDQKAKLAYELLVADVPRDSVALNNLAWLYLTTSDSSLRNPQRGLELALRAVELSRAPQILDTAAEARFQTGEPAEAVKLEQEAIDTLPRFAGFEDKRFTELLQQHLETFQNAATSGAPAAL
jgi:tetratricopeptide (TPR) repeat protein